MYCAQCGAKLPDNANYCGECGSRTIFNNQPQPQQQPKGNATVQGIIFIVAVIMVLYALASILSV